MFKSSFLLVYDLTLHDFGQIRLYMTLVKSDYMTLVKTEPWQSSFG